MPLDWAMTQNNLGNALSTLGERESGTARLEEAVAAYRAALEERTRERVPLDWAMTQNNLGNALQGWASGRAGRRGWRRRSPPIARRSRNGPASGCRLEGGAAQARALAPRCSRRRRSLHAYHAWNLVRRVLTKRQDDASSASRETLWPGFVPAIHLVVGRNGQPMDARIKSAHDERT